MRAAQLTQQDIETFWNDGYVFKRGLLASDEVAMVDTLIRNDTSISKNSVLLDDSAGGSTELAVWNHPGDDLLGVISRSERVAGGAAKLLDTEVYHYHSKLTMKRPRKGGAWDWHQDYGYWYKNGCLFPDMLSVAIAVDPATRENGCLQFLRGSHKAGRIEHGRVGGQTGADIDRVEALMTRLDHVYAEMRAGDAVFFHANTLHASAANTSDKSRNVLLCCYNAASNDPVKKHHHPGYTKLDIVPDERIREVGRSGAVAHLDFLNHEEDETVVGKRATSEA
jgi:hypothetical protein